jgi:serine/threonine-protein kinase
MGKRILIYLAIALAAIVGIALLFNVLMTVFIGGRQVTVPDVRGLSEPDARITLGDLGLRYELTGDRFSVEYPESTIGSQDPSPGKIVKQGRKVLLTLSLGGEFQDVPSCIGKPLRTAKILLERAGFTVGAVARVASADSYPEEVLATEPVPGSEAIKGSLVRLLVSSGPRRPKVLMPDLRGKAFLKVKMKLERMGLFVTETTLDPEFVPVRSSVVSQVPPPGFVTSSGDTVNLIISARPKDRSNL